MFWNRIVRFFRLVSAKRVSVLLLTWLFALFFGYCHGIRSPGLACDCFFVAGFLPQSVVLFSLVSFGLFLFSALAAFFIPFTLFPLAFFKAYFYGISISCIRLTFTGAAWIVLPLLCFTETLSIPIYLGFWCQQLQQGSAVLLKNLFIPASALVLVLIADCCIISPFLYRVVCYM